ncbi:MAG TPA: hypothetical protein VE398_07960 [Acidobacteriota bacterium]|nr:hypothetical protein [Acidobacteriota bacterium]
MKRTDLAEDRGRVFSRWRILKPADVPALDDRVIDVAVLDMNKGWPNLGHDLIVRAVGEVAQDLGPLLEAGGLLIRVLSYDVRASLMIPEAPGRRHQVYLGTGGPGHIDPHLNDGVTPGTQGICEDASWEAPLFRLFDGIRAQEQAALLAVCHTYGVLCRWAGAARPALRGQEKGGKRAGVSRNVLTEDGCRHPWFSRFAAQLSDGRHFSVLDNRLYDLIRENGATLPAGVTAIAYESAGPDREVSDAITMLEFAPDSAGIMPRMFAVNHHPEVRDRKGQIRILRQKLSRGEVSMDWYDERVRTLREGFSSPDVEGSLQLTSQYTFLAPLRFHLYRQVRLRAASLGRKVDLHEDQALRPPVGMQDKKSNIPL